MSVTARYANPDRPMASMVIEVETDYVRFYVFGDLGENALEIGDTKTATVDLRVPLTREEWEAEYGGLATWEELRAAIEVAYKEGLDG
jgi:hypothetical protein